jgi:hypothetical protein
MSLTQILDLPNEILEMIVDWTDQCPHWSGAVNLGHTCLQMQAIYNKWYETHCFKWYSDMGLYMAQIEYEDEEATQEFQIFY